MNAREIDVIRTLAGELATLAALPIQDEKRRLWRKLNAREPERPMVMIDQVCWNEMNVDDALTLRCEDPDCRHYEQWLRRTLFQWRHFPVDSVIEPLVRVPRAVTHTGHGVVTQDTVAVGDPTNSVVGHHFENQFTSDADLDKVKPPVVTHDPGETARRLDVAHTLFDGVLTVEAAGFDPSYMTVWDPISFWMSVEGALYGLIDRPEFMTELVRRVVQGDLALLDQLESQNLLCGPQSLIHCTGAWTDELPAPGYDPGHPRVKDLWMFGMAQMFSTVSPAMHETFEIDLCMPLFERFGCVYYGCCEPLDLKIEQIRRIPNLRKISMSPWVDEERGAAAIGGDFVYSRKPSPALLAWPDFNPRAVREHIQASVDTCARQGCPLELILKDISTVKYEPQRLFDWARIAMEIVESGG